MADGTVWLPHHVPQQLHREENCAAISSSQANCICPSALFFSAAFLFMSPLIE